MGLGRSGGRAGAGLTVTRMFHFASASLSDVGRVRKLNEDACLDRSDLGLWVVADGMGGHQGGDYASRHIVELLGELGPPSSASSFLADVRARLARSNDALRNEAAARGPDTIIASTIVALLAFDHHFACLWAGDSRLYLLRDHQLHPVTRDHSHVQDLVELGVINADEAESHPQANVVTRAVGADEGLELDKRHDKLQEGDIFLLCSDGLTRVVPDDQIAGILDNEDIDQAVRSLMDAALTGGSRDNVTVVVVRCMAAAGWDRTVPFSPSSGRDAGSAATGS